MSPRPVRVGVRSTLYVLDDGRLARRYHDTGHYTDPISPPGRRPSSPAPKPRTFRASSSPSSAEPPPHLHNALRCLCREPESIDQLASMCGVKTSTAWCYACRVVETWPRAHEVARPLVHPSILSRVQATQDTSGSLRTFFSRLQDDDDTFRGDTDVRCLEDRYAHLRLARLCVEAARET